VRVVVDDLLAALELARELLALVVDREPVVGVGGVVMNWWVLTAARNC
jgi:hypothetical protein